MPRPKPQSKPRFGRRDPLGGSDEGPSRGDHPACGRALPAADHRQRQADPHEMTNEPAPLRWTRRAVLAGLGGLAALPRAARAAGSPARIASLGGAVTEILYRLGAADRIVAVDTTSIYPA